MLGWINKWINSQSQKMDDEMYMKGFCWVMVEYYINREHLKYIEAVTRESEHPFDEGAKKALHIIKDKDNSILCRACKMPIISAQD